MKTKLEGTQVNEHKNNSLREIEGKEEEDFNNQKEIKWGFEKKWQILKILRIIEVLLKEKPREGKRIKPKYEIKEKCPEITKYVY